jgi:hypothetical protein
VPALNDRRQRADPALWMVLRPKARKVPMLWAKDKMMQFTSISPPLLPKILQVLDGCRIAVFLLVPSLQEA